jgi:hypothetical protein
MTKEISVDISSKGDKISCSIKVPPYNMDRRIPTRFTSQDVKQMLIVEGHDLSGYILEQDTTINNRGNPPLLEATWVFSKPKKAPAKARKTRATTKTTKE